MKELFKVFIVEKVKNGELTPGQLHDFVKEVTDNYVGQLFEESKENEWNVDNEDYELWVEMFETILHLEPDDVELEANLYALIQTFKQTKMN